MDAKVVPTFQLNKPRYTQSTFYGRFRHFLDVIDPATLFTTEEELKNAIKLLDDYKNGRIEPTVTDEDLWKAQKIKQAIIHPDTGEKIFMPFRMSGFVPFGSPIVTGLLIPNPTIIQTVFWQWLNQSHNACVNYANRNASKPTNMTTFIQGYAGATTAAVSIAVSLSVLLEKAERFSPATRSLIQRFVPFPAVATASVCNLLLMRRHELGTGIDVFDSNEIVIGTSTIAAKRAIQDTAITRAVLPAPIFLIPPLILTQLEKTKWLKSHPRWHLPINASLVTLSFGMALPLAIALFPQTSQISVDDLEPEFKEKTKEAVLYFNKGL